MNEMNPQATPQATPEAAPQAAPEVTPEMEAMLDAAIKVLYGETFGKMVALFENAPDQFEQNIATVINAVVEKVATDYGAMDMNAAAVIGGTLFEMLVDDLVAGGVVQEPTQEMIIGGMQQTLSLWIQNNQDQVDPNTAGQTLQELQSVLEQGPAQEPPPAQTPEGGMA